MSEPLAWQIDLACVSAGRCSISGVSVTRFGKISPLLAKVYKSLAHFDGLFLIWHNAEPSLANL